MITRVLGDYELWLLPEHFEFLCPGTRQEEGHCLVRDHGASGEGWAPFYTTEAETNMCGMEASHLGASEYCTTHCKTTAGAGHDDQEMRSGVMPLLRY